MKTPLRLLTFIIFTTAAFNTFGQASEISNLSPQEPARNHYQELKKLSAAPRPDKAWMDTIFYPPALYKNYTMLFALAEPVYLTSDQVDFLVGSVAFPANSSDQTRAELDFLMELQNKRTSQQEARVMEIARIGYWPDAGMLASHPNYEQNLDHLFWEVREVMGNSHQAEQLPFTTKLLKGVMIDMRLMEFAVKYNLLRARPYQLETQLQPLRKISSPSFASGHTLWAYVQAYILAELIPSKRKEFIDLAYEVGFSRELMGVHYPSDEEVARQLAHRMVLLMWNTKSFQDDFAKAKEEWQ